MKRINPSVSDEAAKIYDSYDHHIRGKFVSDAIIEKANRGTVSRAEFDELAKEVRELREKINGQQIKKKNY